MMFGQVNNGDRLDAVFPFYVGIVGVRQREGYIEAAYLGTKPQALPEAGTIDGKPVRVIAAAYSIASRAMIVLTVLPVESEDSVESDVERASG